MRMQLIHCMACWQRLPITGNCCGDVALSKSMFTAGGRVEKAAEKTKEVGKEAQKEANK